jgi:hypothetical protein
MKSDASLASAVITGANLDATACLSAYTESLPFPMGGGPFSLNLDSVDGATIHLTLPTDGSQPYIQGFLQIAANAPGVYTSSDPNASGSLSFSYALPVPPEVDCSASQPPSCPPGCMTECAGGGGGSGGGSSTSTAGSATGNGSSDGSSQTSASPPSSSSSASSVSIIDYCEPCTAINPMVTYTAAEGSYEPHGGSWTLTLTAGGPNPHGTIEAILVGTAVTNTGDAGANPGNATLYVSF